MKWTGYLHIVALVVAIYGTIKQVESVKQNKPASIWLSLSLAVMLLLRIPNQICVALEQSHGWYSVMGTVMGSISFLYLTYVTYESQKKTNKNKKTHYEAL